jgi:hypothetical protein
MALDLSDLKPVEFQRVIHAALINNPFLLESLLMAAGNLVDDAHRILYDQGRGYRQDAKVMERARKDLMRTMGEIMRTEALDKYDEILATEADEGDEGDECDDDGVEVIHF